MSSPRWTQILVFVAAAALLAGAGLLQQPLDEQSQRHELVPRDDMSARQYPGVRLLMMAPGGARAVAVNYLWARSEQLKQDGKFHEASQLASMITTLQPHYVGAWSFQAWNMAWNISVATQTPEERWLWVHNGMKLLRDDGIRLNPRALILYKELGWVFFSKMSDTMDEMHMVYKQRWAGMMQRVLASPPLGETDEVIDAFRPIAAAPLDRDPLRQGKETIQADKLREVLTDGSVAAYADLLRKQGVEVGWALLDAYNRLSTDDAAASFRLAPPELKTDADKSLSALLNDPARKPALGKLLAFARAQVLWNTYRMDPAWMLEMMERFKAPLDWRSTLTHGMYWVWYGIRVCGSEQLGSIDSLNTDRVLLDSLKRMTFYGRMWCRQNPQSPDMPDVFTSADWRYIKPTCDAYDHYSDAIANAVVGELMHDAKNTFEAGHTNYTIVGIEMLYAMGRTEEASRLLDYIRKRYNKNDPDWRLELEEFVMDRLNREGKPIPDVASALHTAAVITAHAHLGAGRQDGYRAYMRFANLVYDKFNTDAADRLRWPPRDIVQGGIILELLIDPRPYGLTMPLADRIKVYQSLNPNMQAMLYAAIEQLLRPEIEADGLDFDRAIPKPPDYEEILKQLRRRMEPLAQPG
jgi:hypothetical protein